MWIGGEFSNTEASTSGLNGGSCSSGASMRTMPVVWGLRRTVTTFHMFMIGIAACGKASSRAVSAGILWRTRAGTSLSMPNFRNLCTGACQRSCANCESAQAQVNIPSVTVAMMTADASSLDSSSTRTRPASRLTGTCSFAALGSSHSTTWHVQ